jgi:hypothetical protein
MTRIRLLAFALALAFASASSVIACGARTEGLDRRKLPEDIHADYDLFARKCSKCHSLARPLQSGITVDAQWVNYVNRMRRQPGSGITYDDQEHILRFLRWFAADLRAKEGRGGASPAAPDASPPTPPPPPPAPAPPMQGPTPTTDEPKDGG